MGPLFVSTLPKPQQALRVRVDTNGRCRGRQVLEESRVNLGAYFLRKEGLSSSYGVVARGVVDCRFGDERNGGVATTRAGLWWLNGRVPRKRSVRDQSDLKAEDLNRDRSRTDQPSEKLCSFVTLRAAIAPDRRSDSCTNL